MKVVKENGGKYEFPYIAYIPENLSKNPALLIQLHGAGERGDGKDDLEKVLKGGFPTTVNDNNLKDCILVMPQCPTDTFWVAKIESIKKFIDKIIADYSIDESRVYLCGLSMGGFGTWFTAMAHPDMFAAIAPCCGGMAWNAHTLKMPVWAFHGLDDTMVSPRHTIEMVENLRETNSNVKCDLYKGVGHHSWEIAFTEPTLNWLLSHKKEG